MSQPLVLQDSEKIILDVKIVGDRVMFIEQDGSFTIAATIIPKVELIAAKWANGRSVPAKPKGKAGRKSNAEKARIANEAAEKEHSAKVSQAQA